MKKILLIHGPNLNLLGEREKEHYGGMTLAKLESTVGKEARRLGIKIVAFQSNHEGRLIDFLQKHRKADGIMLDARIPAVEVHLSDISMREDWRKVSVTAPACAKMISGKKIEGYLEALNYLSKI